MIMVQTSKKCSAMRKFITTMLIAAAAFTACVQNDDNIVVNTDNKITFTAQLNAPESRTVLVKEGNKFHAEWCVGDRVELFEITETGGTLAKGNNPGGYLEEGGLAPQMTFELSEKTADKYYYILGSNNPSVNGAGTTIAFVLPAGQAPAAMNTFDGAADLIISKAVERDAQPTEQTEAIVFENTRVTAIGEVTIKNLALAAGDAVKSVTFACEQQLAGKCSMKTTQMFAGKHPLTEASFSSPVNAINVTLPEPQTGDFSYYMSVWPATLAEGEKCTVTVETTSEKTFVKEITIPEDLAFTTGDITAFTVNMKGIKDNSPIVMPDYVEVAGVKWAMGNLEYEKDTTTEGFAAGWKIAPSQYHHFNMEKDGDYALTDYNKAAHFNFGGLSDNALTYKYSAALHIAAIEPAFDFSGKMYTDNTCATETSDFVTAKFGDVAFWASKGQYRMPTATEFGKLYTDACYTLATYVDGAYTIKGTYFYNPANGETAGLVDGTKTLTEEDFTVGLFLPWSGRAYNNVEYKIYKVGSQGYYRTSTVGADSKDGQGYGVIYRVNDHTNLVNTGSKSVDDGVETATTYNFGATARYAIRPILVE